MEQLNLFDYIENIPKTQVSEPPIYTDTLKTKYDKLLSVGDKIGKVVLGECRIGTVKAVEGNEQHCFYRLNEGYCLKYEDGLNSIDDLIAEAEKNRRNYQTVEPKDLVERITVRYRPRECDGKILWAQIGIWNGMLFWKMDMTYQFLEVYPDEKQLRKAYKKQKEEIMKSLEWQGRIRGEIVDKEMPMRRLYWSNKGFYADAEYVKHNG